MKKFLLVINTFLICLLTFYPKPVYVCKFAKAEEVNKKQMAIVIDDFGGYERAGVKELLESDIDITCAIMPFVEHSEDDYHEATRTGKEIILHMPMQAHVHLPESWYGPVYITNYDSPKSAIEKLEKCLKTMPDIKGFNIHIGSGVSRNEKLMQAMYDYANKNNLYFLDSRTNVGDKCEEASKMSGSIYLGRDVFLEPNKNRSYAGVLNRLNDAKKIAEEKGYVIVIGHVGAEGGINTAKAIIDFAKNNSDVQIVPLSKIYNQIKENQYK